MDWYYAHNDEKTGPVSEEQLVALVETGTLGPSSLIWNEGYDSWVALEQVFEFGEEDAEEEVVEEEEEEEVEWFYAFSGEEQNGPCTFESLGEAWKDGTIDGDTLVWTEGLGDWEPIANVTAFSAYAPPPKPKPKPKKKTGGKQIRIQKGGTTKTVRTSSRSSSSSSSSNVYASPQSDPRRKTGEAWRDEGIMWLFFDRRGRIPRKLYWMSVLISIPVGFVASFILVGLMAISPILFLIGYILLIVLSIFSSICIQSKRWHDRGKSAWWVLIGFIPIVGIWAFIECGFLRGTEGPNEFGADPLGGR